MITTYYAIIIKLQIWLHYITFNQTLHLELVEKPDNLAINDEISAIQGIVRSLEEELTKRSQAWCC